jgi:adenylyl-sulfate kinase
MLLDCGVDYLALNERSLYKRQYPKVFWFTGLSGAGKSTLANMLERKLQENNLFSYVIDGDRVRKGLNSDLDFSDAARRENIRRVAHVAELMYEAGLVVICSLISPIEEERDKAKALFPEGDFYEIYIKVDLDVAIERDVKGLYKKAKDGLVKQMTGIASRYVEPMAPDLIVDTSNSSINESFELLWQFVSQVKFFPEVESEIA